MLKVPVNELLKTPAFRTALASLSFRLGTTFPLFVKIEAIKTPPYSLGFVTEEENAIYISDRLDKVTDILHVIAHETLHYLLRHMPRRHLLLGKNPSVEDLILSNLAADEMVENILHALLEKPLLLPEELKQFDPDAPNFFTQSSYKRHTFLSRELGIDTSEMSFEALYKFLKDLSKLKSSCRLVKIGLPDGQTVTGKVVQGVIEITHESKTLEIPVETTIILPNPNYSPSIKDLVKASHDRAQLRKNLVGIAPGTFENELGSFVNVVLNLKSHLTSLITTMVRGFDDISFYKQSRRSFVLSQRQKVLVPSYISNQVKALISIDVSGSISDQMFTEFVSAIRSNLKTFTADSLVVQIDADIQHVEKLSSFLQNPKKLLKRKGYGGTVVKPLEDILRKGKFQVWIHFTDGEIYDIENVDSLARYTRKTLLVLPIYLKKATNLRRAQIVYFWPASQG